MYQSGRNSWGVCLVLVVVLCMAGVGCSESTKGKVVEIDPSSVEYLANSFDQLMVFFLQEKND